MVDGMNLGRYYRFMPKSYKLAGIAILAVCALLWMTYVWPTQWRYYHYDANYHYNLRVNRFTGRTELLDLGGWHSTAPITNH